MADFEFYTKNVPLEPAPVAIAPRETVGSVLGQALSQAGAGLLEKGIRVKKEIGFEKASEAGTMEGTKLGFVPKEAKTEQDILFNRAAVSAQKMSIQNSVRARTMGIQQDVLSNSSLNSVNEYNARIQNYAKTLLPTIAPAFQDYAKNNIEYYGLTHKQSVVREVDSIHKNMALSNTQLSYNNTLRDSTNAAFQGNQEAAIAQRIDMTKNLDSQLAVGNVTGSYHAAAVEQLDTSIKMSRYLGGFNNAIANNTANDYIANFVKTNQKDLSPARHEKQQLLTQFRTKLNDHKQMILAQYGNIDNKVRDLATSITLNGVNPATLGQKVKLTGIVNDYYSQNKDKAKALIDSMDFAQDRNIFKSANRYVNPAIMQQNLFEKEKALKAAPVEGKFEKAQQFAMLTKDVSSILSERKDPTRLYEIISQNPAVMAATNAEQVSNQANVSMTTGARLGPATKGSIQDRDEAMLQLQHHMGIPSNDRVLIDPKEIQTLGSFVAEGDPAKSVSTLQTILAQHEGHRNEVWAQVQKSVKTPLALFYDGAMNPKTAPRRDYMFTAARRTVKELEDPLVMEKGDATAMKNKVRKNIMEDYGAAVLNKNGDPTTVIDSAVDYCYKLALVYKTNGLAAPAELAVKDALTEHARFSTYNGRHVMIPASNAYGATDVKMATAALLQNLDAKMLHVPASFGLGTQDIATKKAYKNFLTTDAYPAMNIENSGMLILNGQRQPVKIIDGDSKNASGLKNMEFNFKDLNYSGSDLNVQMEKQRKLLHQRFVNAATRELIRTAVTVGVP